MNKRRPPLSEATLIDDEDEEMVANDQAVERLVIVTQCSLESVSMAEGGLSMVAAVMIMRETLIYLSHLDHKDTEKQENRFLVMVIRDLLNLHEITIGKENKALLQVLKEVCESSQVLRDVDRDLRRSKTYVEVVRGKGWKQVNGRNTYAEVVRGEVRKQVNGLRMHAEEYGNDWLFNSLVVMVKLPLSFNDFKADMQNRDLQNIEVKKGGGRIAGISYAIRVVEYAEQSFGIQSEANVTGSKAWVNGGSHGRGDQSCVCKQMDIEEEDTDKAHCSDDLEAQDKGMKVVGSHVRVNPKNLPVTRKHKGKNVVGSLAGEQVGLENRDKAAISKESGPKQRRNKRMRGSNRFCKGFHRGAIFRAAAVVMSSTLSVSSGGYKHKLSQNEAQATVKMGKDLGIEMGGYEENVIQKIMEMENQDEERLAKMGRNRED
ncbi:Protein EXPORTIN 1A [Camellia lanceoleosa]|uniref:Protein EXPORTIN 1A n=1 Tax=Camellia lanceoleosa TaxID=1840588 RepID=A0ACC0IE75_9ERIC|nr:Protein EXPORTIN 1A [Camellia lanceoleosa]